MDAYEAAEVLVYELNKSPWKAELSAYDEIIWTNEDGEQFRLTVEMIED